MATIPSISLIPSGYKAGKVYSVLPTDGSGDLDFARTTTARRINSDSLIEEVAIGVPRLDYTDGGCPSLLLEPASINLITQSEAFDNAYWTKTGATVTSGFSSPSVDSPLGAFVLESTGTGQMQAVYTGSIGVKYTASFWIKRKTGSGGVNLRSVENTNTPITITNEWARYSLPVTSTSTSIRAGLKLDTIGDEVYIFASQLEAQSYATSYIPTAGSAATRTADSASKSGISSLINSSEGVFYCKIAALADDLTFRFLSLLSSDNANKIQFYFRTGSNELVTQIVSNGSAVYTNTSPITITDFNQLAIRWDGTNVTTFINGVPVNTASGISPLNLSVLQYANTTSNSTPMFSKTKDLRIYKTALTDAELTTLTTL